MSPADLFISSRNVQMLVYTDLQRKTQSIWRYRINLSLDQLEILAVILNHKAVMHLIHNIYSQNIRQSI